MDSGARPDTLHTAAGDRADVARRLATLGVPDRYNAGARPYYEDLGQQCDWVVRCDDCKVLVTAAQIHAAGGCWKCGCNVLREVRTLSTWEYFKIWIGIIDFPHRRAFLDAFAGKGDATA